MWQADQYCNSQHPVRPLMMDVFSPPSSCIAPSSTVNASQQVEGFLVSPIDSLCPAVVSLAVVSYHLVNGGQTNAIVIAHVF